ncbi:MAG: RimK family alpha-L-glutamate ligase [Acidimicrobiia bacterium]
MRLFFMLVRRIPPAPSPMLVEVFELLSRRGFRIASAVAEERVVQPERLAVEHDLFVLKSHTELSLSLASVFDTLGARILNPYRSCATTQDKIVAARRLNAAGVSVPRSWVTGELELLSELLGEISLIAKPHRGHRGSGIAVIRTKAELRSLATTDTPFLIQEYIEGEGEDLKVYVVGEQVFAVRKPFSATSFSKPGRSVSVTADVKEIALAAGRVLGLGLYGLDLVESSQGPVVVDVNYFPGFKGVPDVAPLIADYIEDYAHGSNSLVLPDLDPEGYLVGIT